MHIPLDKLPTDIQQQVINYLDADNFIAAKHVRDQYELQEQNAKKLAGSVTPKSQPNVPQKSHLTDLD